jgi:flagellar basal-body rod protein FlgF
MDNTLLINLSQQVAAGRSMDVIANNLANMSTPAFKRESVKFEEFVEQVRPAEGETAPQSVSFVQDKGIMRDLNEGRIERTGNPFDLALNGNGYFVIQTPTGNQYTRNGHFTLDASGQVVTEDGDPVLGQGGPITVTPNDGDIHIAADGTVTGKNGQLGQIQLVDFANDRALQKQGASLYSTTQAPTTPTNVTISQGMLESSNVEPVLEITHMIDVMRAYQASASLNQSQETMLRAAIDKLGAPPN